jgi:sugar-specific transcriptional regulator TrmB
MAIMESHFKRLGLNKNEQLVYLEILKAGKLPPHRIARLTGINRTTVYSIAKKLETRGLIAIDLGQKVHYLVALPPERFLTLYESEEKALTEKKLAAEALIAELNTLTSEKQFSIPRIRFVEEIDLRSYLYEAYPRWSESVASHGNMWRGFQDDSFTSVYADWIEWTWQQDVQKTLGVEFFVNDATIESSFKAKYATRNMKTLPHGISFDSSFWITGEYLIMAQTRVRPHYLVEIHDAVLARNQLQLFKGLWQLAP